MCKDICKQHRIGSAVSAAVDLTNQALVGSLFHRVAICSHSPLPICLHIPPESMSGSPADSIIDCATHRWITTEAKDLLDVESIENYLKMDWPPLVRIVNETSTFSNLGTYRFVYLGAHSSRLCSCRVSSSATIQNSLLRIHA